MDVTNVANNVYTRTSYTHCIGHHRLSCYIILYRGNCNLGWQFHVTYINNTKIAAILLSTANIEVLFCTRDFYYFLQFLYTSLSVRTRNTYHAIFSDAVWLVYLLSTTYYTQIHVHEGNNFFFEINYLWRCHYCYYDYYQVHILLPQYLAVSYIVEQLISNLTFRYLQKSIAFGFAV